MPYEKGTFEIKDLAGLRAALKPYGFSGTFDSKAKGILEEYKSLKGNLKRCAGDCSARDFIQLLDKSYTACVMEIAKFKKSKEEYLKKEASEIPEELLIKESGLDIESLRHAAEGLAEMDKLFWSWSDCVYDLRNDEIDSPKGKELKDKLIKDTDPAVWIKLRDKVCGACLSVAEKRFVDTVTRLDKADHQGFIATFPCTAAFMRILAGIGGVSKYSFEERLEKGGLIPLLVKYHCEPCETHCNKHKLGNDLTKRFANLRTTLLVR